VIASPGLRLAFGVGGISLAGVNMSYYNSTDYLVDVSYNLRGGG
jgi:hypothetical protein